MCHCFRGGSGWQLAPVRPWFLLSHRARGDRDSSPDQCPSCKVGTCLHRSVTSPHDCCLFVHSYWDQLFLMYLCKCGKHCTQFIYFTGLILKSCGYLNYKKYMLIVLQQIHYRYIIISRNALIFKRIIWTYTEKLNFQWCKNKILHNNCSHFSALLLLLNMKVWVCGKIYLLLVI